MVSKAVLTVICVTVFVLVSGCTQREPQYTLLDGQSIQFSDLHGRLILINYWAIWCKPCREEIPELNRFAAEKSDQVAVFGLNYDKALGEELRQQVETMGITFPTLLEDPKQWYLIKSSGVLPETLVFDTEGNYQKTLIGPQTCAALEKLLDTSTD